MLDSRIKYSTLPSFGLHFFKTLGRSKDMWHWFCHYLCLIFPSVYASGGLCLVIVLFPGYVIFYILQYILLYISHNFWKRTSGTCAPSEDSDQPAYLRIYTLFGTFAGRFKPVNLLQFFFVPSSVVSLFYFLWDHWAHCAIFENVVLLLYSLEGVSSVANFITDYEESQ